MLISPVSGPNSASNVTSIYNYGLRYMARPSQAAQPGVPVRPVQPSLPVYTEAARPTETSPLFARAYHAEQAARSRVQYPGDSPVSRQAYPLSQAYGEEMPAALSGPADRTLPGAYPAELAARMRTQYPQTPGTASEEPLEISADLGAEGAQKAADEGRCETCESRRYQDGSDDISVSFQTPTQIDPDTAASAVRGHEMEHVAHEQAKAQQEDRKVVSQTVTLHTDICPECGRAYISGGTTRTVTKGNSQPAQADQAEPSQDPAAPESGQEE